MKGRKEGKKKGTSDGKIFRNASRNTKETQEEMNLMEFQGSLKMLK